MYLYANFNFKFTDYGKTPVLYLIYFLQTARF